jgi:hypothetical protein
MFFSKPKFKKIDSISYKGYTIPIYSNGKEKYAGHFHREGEEELTHDMIYSIDDISELKNTIFMIDKHGDDIDLEPFMPNSIGKIEVSKSK